MKTQITVKRTDGTVETVEKPGHITSLTARAKFEAATLATGKGQIVGWALVGKLPTGPSYKQVLYNQLPPICKGCGRRGDDGECGRGNY